MPEHDGTPQVISSTIGWNRGGTVSDGIESLNGPYKQVKEAAQECGIGDHFSLSYRMLSKFAHPTAMQILASPDEARDALQKDCFFSQGCLFFTGAFVALEGQLI